MYKILSCIFSFLFLLFLLTASTVSLHASEKGNPASDKSEIIKLPAPSYDSNVSVEKALKKRRSIRLYTDKALRLADISQLLWAAQGITDSKGFRTAPSAGALYPLELYIVAGNIENLPCGIYKYSPYTHELRRVIKGDRRTELCDAALGQLYVKNAVAIIIFSAVYERTTAKYGERGIRYVHMEVGHAAQNVYLQAMSLNLGTLFIGAFHDGKVKKILQMSEKEHPLSLMPVGAR